MTSSRGDVLFYGPGKRGAIVRRDGTRREIDSPWDQAGSWSPDGRSGSAGVPSRLPDLLARLRNCEGSFE